MNANIQFLKRFPTHMMLWEWRGMLSKKWNAILSRHKSERLSLIKHAQEKTFARQTIGALALKKRGSYWYRKSSDDPTG